MNTAATTKRSVARRRRACSRFAVGLSFCILVGPGFLVRPQAAIICDGDPVPVTLRASPSTINESGTTAAQLIFTLGGAVGNTTRLTLQVSGTAANGVDFQTIPSQVSIPAGRTGATLALVPIADMIVEGTETVTVSITASDNACVAIGSPNTATVSITEGADLLLSTALDETNLVWTTGGGAPWTPQTSVTHDGIDAAQSGLVSDDRESWLQTTVSGPGTVTFWWRVSSEPDFDWLRFHIGGVLQQQISGEVDWQKRSFSVPDGPHALRWRYIKDLSGFAGQDSAWVDELTWTPASGTPTVVLQPRSQTVWAGANVTLSAVALGEPPLWHQSYYNDIHPIVGATQSSLTLTNVRPADAGRYHVVVSNALNSVTSSMATVTITNNGPASAVLLFVDGTFASPYQAALAPRSPDCQATNWSAQTFLRLPSWREWRRTFGKAIRGCGPLAISIRCADLGTPSF